MAENNFFEIINPILLQMVYDSSTHSTGYFRIQRPEQYDAMTKHMNSVKTKVFSEFIKKNSTVIDFGCGQGQDIHKYIAL